MSRTLAMRKRCRFRNFKRFNFEFFQKASDPLTNLNENQHKPCLWTKTENFVP